MFHAPEYDIIRFSLRPNPTLLPSLARYPDDPKRRPWARAMIVRGSFEDELFLVGRYIKPNLRLEMFTVEHSPLLADGSMDPSFDRFGLAWYQSNVEADENGVISANFRGVLLDPFFGMDARLRQVLAGTFHVGLWFSDLWFSDPEDAEDQGEGDSAPAGGRRRSGPLAMISTPIAATGLGPLCTHPSPRDRLADYAG